jgi:hypothetical protein
LCERKELCAKSKQTSHLNATLDKEQPALVHTQSTAIISDGGVHRLMLCLQSLQPQAAAAHDQLQAATVAKSDISIKLGTRLLCDAEAALLLLLQVDESMRACAGGGNMAAKERVEALSLPVAAIDAFITDESLAKTPGLCFGLLWGRHWLQQQGQPQQSQ